MQEINTCQLFADARDSFNNEEYHLAAFLYDAYYEFEIGDEDAYDKAKLTLARVGIDLDCWGENSGRFKVRFEGFYPDTNAILN